MLYKRGLLWPKIILMLLMLAISIEVMALRDLNSLRQQIQQRMTSGEDISDLFSDLRILGYGPEKNEALSLVDTAMRNFGKKIAPAPSAKAQIAYSIVNRIPDNNIHIKIAELKDSFEREKSLDTLVNLLHLMIFDTKNATDKSIEEYLDKLRDNYPEAQFSFTYYSGLFSLKTDSNDEARKYFIDAATNTIDKLSKAEMLLRAATIYKNTGNFEEAVRYYSQAFDLVNDFSPLDNYLIRYFKFYDTACLDYAVSLHNQNNYWAAVYYYRKQPLNETALIALADLFLGELKNKTNARQTIDLLKTVNPAKYEEYWKRFQKEKWEVDNRYPINKLLTR